MRGEKLPPAPRTAKEPEGLMPSVSPISGIGEKQRRASSVFFLCLLTLLTYWARISGPADLMSNNEVRVSAYILDAVLNGKLSCQVDGLGSITSKPPLYTWLSVGIYHFTGRIN